MPVLNDNSLIFEFVGSLALGDRPNSMSDPLKNTAYNLADCYPFSGTANLTYSDGWVGNGTIDNPYGFQSTYGSYLYFLNNCSLYTPLHLASPQFSIEIWYKAYQPNNCSKILVGYATTKTYLWWFGWSNAGYPCFARGRSDGVSEVIAGPSRPPGWSTSSFSGLLHQVVTFNNGLSCLYLNGSQVASVSGWSSSPLTTDTYSASFSFPRRFDSYNNILPSKIYVVRIFLRELTSSEVAQLYSDLSWTTPYTGKLFLLDTGFTDITDFIKQTYKVVEYVNEIGLPIGRYTIDGSRRKYISQGNNSLLLQLQVQGSELIGTYPKTIKAIRLYKTMEETTPAFETVTSTITFSSDTDIKTITTVLNVK